MSTEPTGGMIMSAEEMARLVDGGAACRLAGTPAVRYGNTWWLGDATIYVRVLDRAMLADFDERERRRQPGLAPGA